MSAIEQRILEKTWFYRFQLPNGKITSTYDDGALDGIHTSRLTMLQQVIDERFGGTLQGQTAIDIACHQGWFATKLAQWKADDVLAIDARPEHVADTTLMRDALGLSKLRVQQSDVHALQPATLGQFDLVLMLGLIYHLENPIGALRQAHALTRQACVVETQVVPGMSGMVDYGSYRFVRPLKGSFGIIDETDDTHGPEASTTGICLVPSTEALVWIMRKIGFVRVDILPPPADAYEQLLHGKRVMVVGYVD